MNNLPVILVGAGGHGRVLIDALQSAGVDVIGAIDPDERAGRELGVTYLGGDDALSRYPPSGVRLANGLGSTSDMLPRRRLFEKLKAAGYQFARVIHPAAVVASSCELGEGAQV